MISHRKDKKSNCLNQHRDKEKNPSKWEFMMIDCMLFSLMLVFTFFYIPSLGKLFRSRFRVEALLENEKICICFCFCWVLYEWRVTVTNMRNSHEHSSARFWPNIMFMADFFDQYSAFLSRFNIASTSPTIWGIKFFVKICRTPFCAFSSTLGFVSRSHNVST